MTNHERANLLVRLVERRYGSIGAAPDDDPDLLEARRIMLLPNGHKQPPDPIVKQHSHNDSIPSQVVAAVVEMYKNGTQNDAIAAAVHLKRAAVDKILYKSRKAGLISGKRRVEYELFGFVGTADEVADLAGVPRTSLFSIHKYSKHLHKTGRMALR